MPQTKIVVDYSRCDPEGCEEGICAAALVCEKKVLRQEGPGEMPDFFPSMCLGCTDCLIACPQGAIRKMQ